MPLCMIVFYFCFFLFLLYRRYISYRLLLSLKIFTFWTRDDTLLVPAIRAENESAIKCWSNVRITPRRTFSYQRSNDQSTQVKRPIKQNRTFKKSINSESHLHFNSAFMCVGLNPSPRFNAYFSLSQWPTQCHDYWSRQTLRADYLNWLLAFIINPDEASFPCFAGKAFKVS